MPGLERRAFIAAAVAASVGIGSGLIAGRQWGRSASDEVEGIDVGLAAATAGAVGIGTGLLVGRRTRGPAQGQSIDIVIIGAGVAGTLAAHRLAARYPNKSIAVFESRSRIGGRLWSVPVPPVENEMAELGGMRTPFQHRATLDLIEELGLTTHPGIGTEQLHQAAGNPAAATRCDPRRAISVPNASRPRGASTGRLLRTPRRVGGPARPLDRRR
ncbi:MAG: FAD-dependent oxidoreductase [Candidatus Nanopelagicales bacterium]